MGKRANDLREEYSLRFSNTEKYRSQVWKILCTDFFSRYVHREHAVLDMGSGWGEFINNIEATYKYAMDLNPDAGARLTGGIRFLQQDCSQEWNMAADTLDVVFSSNFLEHLPDKAHVESAISEAHRCLKDNGIVIFLGPNIKYVNGQYWDFWDHFIPLTEQSLGEVLRLKGFEIRMNVARFLPYSMSKGYTPPLFFIKAYLRLSILWKFFGKQFLIVAQKRHP